MAHQIITALKILYYCAFFGVTVGLMDLANEQGKVGQCFVYLANI